MGGILGGKSKGSSGAITTASNAAANGIIQGSLDSAQFNLKGSQTAADYQNQAKEYLERADRLPTELREQALNKLGGIFNGDQYDIGRQISERALASPQYRTAVEQGENAVLRNASATGGLRSGNASDALAQANQNAFLGAYNNAYGEYQNQIQGLQGLASLPSNANNIAQYMAGTGATLGQGLVNYGNTIGQGQVDAANAQAQGQIAAAQNKAQTSQNSTNNMMGLAGLGMQAFSTFSDRRLKSNIEFTGEENGFRKYKWTWNKLASRLGLRGSGSGVMADEVAKTNPEAVSLRDGFMVVDYDSIGASHGF